MDPALAWIVWPLSETFSSLEFCSVKVSADWVSLYCARVVFMAKTTLLPVPGPEKGGYLDPCAGRRLAQDGRRADGLLAAVLGLREVVHRGAAAAVGGDQQLEVVRARGERHRVLHRDAPGL